MNTLLKAEALEPCLELKKGVSRVAATRRCNIGEIKNIGLLQYGWKNYSHLRPPKRPGKEQPEGKRVLGGEGGDGEGKEGVQGGAVVAGVRRAAAVTAFRLEDGQYKVGEPRWPVQGEPRTKITP